MSSRSEPGLRFTSFLTEAWRTARATPVSTGVILLLVAGTAGFILATTGQTVRAEREVLSRLDQAGTRFISVIDPDGSGGMRPDAVERVSRLSGVEWVIGLEVARDGRNTSVGPEGPPVPVRILWGEFPSEIVTNARAPRPDEALVGTTAQVLLGMRHPVGSIDVAGRQIPVVGGFRAAGGLQNLESGVLVTPPDHAGPANAIRSIHVMVTESAQVQAVSDAMREVIAAEDWTRLRFETSQTLAEVRIAVAGDLGRYGRNLVVAALGVSLVLIAIIVMGSVTARRQEFGRRRALGATRGTIIALVAAQAAWVGSLGAVLGTMAGGAIVWRLTGSPPDPSFATAILVLTSLAAVAASIPPAAVAAFRDPVRVLRVP